MKFIKSHALLNAIYRMAQYNDQPDVKSESVFFLTGEKYHDDPVLMRITTGTIASISGEPCADYVKEALQQPEYKDRQDDVVDIWYKNGKVIAFDRFNHSEDENFMILHLSYMWTKNWEALLLTQDEYDKLLSLQENVSQRYENWLNQPLEVEEEEKVTKHWWE